MEYLERIDRQDRADGTPRLDRLRQIPPEVGRFLALLAASAPRGEFLEIGTSAGYSTLWLALACREVGARIVTFELLAEKQDLARETFDEAEVWDVVELVEGDAREHLDVYKNVAFCFLDAEKEHYLDCYEAVVPNLVSAGLLVADNVISHGTALEPFVRKVLDEPLLDALIVPIGRGELLCRKHAGLEAKTPNTGLRSDSA
jgi:caffeoyl-CoA O-methyltransferase